MRRRSRALAGLLLAVGVFATADAGPTPLVLADFDEPSGVLAQRNNVGGAYNVWYASAQASCTGDVIGDDALRVAQGGALRLSYSLASPPHFNGWYTFLAPQEREGADLSVYDRLGFFVKGGTGFSIEIKDRTSRDDGSPRGVAQYLVEPQARNGWTRVEIPFSAFRAKDRLTRIDWSGIRQVVIVFSSSHSEPDGQLLLDQLYASRGTPAF
jgi:hypothetical protein